MANEYDVRARLTLETKKAKSDAEGFRNAIADIGNKVGTTNSMLASMMRTVVGFGGAYVGLNAMQGMFRSLVGSAKAYTSELETTKIGLGSILAAVEGTNLAAGEALANKSFDKLKDLALTSPAGTKQLFEIFNGIVGPMRAAGTEMERIYSMTGNTAVAAAALGVDFGQINRDIALMVRGQAGMDVKTYSILRSMGLIKEETEEWNKKLTTTERIAKLEKALGGFEEAGQKFGKSWTGVMSSFEDLTSEMKRSAMSPIMATIAKHVDRLNTVLYENRDALGLYLTNLGVSVSETIDKAVARGVSAFNYLQDHWGEITNRFNEAMQILRTHGPTLAKVAAGVSAARQVAGTGAVPYVLDGATKAGGAALKGTTALGQATLNAGRSARAGASNVLSGRGLGDVSGMLGAGGGLTTMLAGLKAKLVAVTVAAAPIVIGLAIIAGLAVAVWQNFDLMKQVLLNLLEYSQPVIDRIMEFGKQLWTFLRPVLEGIGLIVTGVLIVAWKTISTVLEYTLMPVLRLLGAIFQWLGEVIEKYALPWLREMVEYLGKNKPKGDDTELKNKKTRDIQILQVMEGATNPGSTDGTGKTTPAARSSTSINVDKMIIKQEFKGKHDPDRILSMFIDDITSQSEQRLSSRYAGALTR